MFRLVRKKQELGTCSACRRKIKLTQRPVFVTSRQLLPSMSLVRFVLSLASSRRSRCSLESKIHYIMCCFWLLLSHSHPLFGLPYTHQAPALSNNTVSPQLSSTTIRPRSEPCLRSSEPLSHIKTGKHSHLYLRAKANINQASRRIFSMHPTSKSLSASISGSSTKKPSQHSRTSSKPCVLAGSRRLRIGAST